MPFRDVELTKRPGGGSIDLAALQRKSWPGIAAQFLRFSAPAAYEFKISPPFNYLQFFDLYRTDGETAIAGLPRFYTKDLRSKMTFLPKGCDSRGWSEIAKAGFMSTLYIGIEHDDLGDQQIDLAQLPPLFAFEDQMLRSAMLRFQAILQDPSLDLPGYAEALGAMLTFEIARVSLPRQRHRLTHQGGLTARQVRLVTDYMDSHLTEKMTISELAALLDLTRFHFIRSFKKTVGMPPHQFIIRRRLDRAKELLEEPGSSIGEVAAKTGFTSTAQLTRAFRCGVGTTPSAFRREKL